MIQIIAVGKLKEAHYQQAAAEYMKRLARYTQLLVSEVADDKEPDRTNPSLEERVKQAEAERILKLIKPRDRVVALCIDGTQDDSLAFSQRMKRLHEAPEDTVFIIGGSLGLGDAILKRAEERISLSRMTYPHQLARVVLLEQIYRAYKILANERYHK